MVLTVPMSTIASTVSQPQGPDYGPGCSAAVARSANAEAATFNQAQAVSLALDSARFIQTTSSYSVSFYDVYDTWSFDSGCNVTLTSVNIVFNLKNASGWAGYAVATEDNASTHVVNVTLQQHNLENGNYRYEGAASGYEFTGNADGTTKVFEAIGSWSVPTVPMQQPSGDCVTAPYCALSAWIGLVHVPGGCPLGDDCSGSQVYTGEGIAQTGSETDIACFSDGSCTVPSASLWYEFWPNPEVDCSGNLGFQVNMGDSIHAYMLNQGWDGGNDGLWNLQITDNRSGNACTVTDHPFNFNGAPIPYLAEFIAETPKNPTCGCITLLPQFDQFDTSGNMYYGGSAQGIYVPYTNGWWTKYVMEACGSPPPNVSVGSVNSANTFTQSWNNSFCKGEA